MRRRDIIGLAGAAALRPFAANAQQRPPRLAFVHTGIPVDRLTESGGPFWVRRFYETMRTLGYVEGGNLVVDRLSAEGHYERFAAIAGEVIGRNPDVIIANSNALTRAFMAATSTIPIVAIVSDPVTTGLVTNLARPGGNLTGVSVNAGIEIFAKRVEILKEAVPSVVKVGHLFAAALNDPTWVSLDDAASRLGIAITRVAMPVVNEEELARTFADMMQQKLGGVMIDEGGAFLSWRATIVALAAKHRIPVVYPFADYVEEGGLMALAPDLGELAARMASDVHRVFNGVKPGDIPFYQPTKFVLIFNLKTARAMGIEMPATLLARADEVME